MFYKQTPVKITGNGLVAGSQQVFYRKIYGFFYSVRVIEICYTCDLIGANMHYGQNYDLPTTSLIIRQDKSIAPFHIFAFAVGIKSCQFTKL